MANIRNPLLLHSTTTQAVCPLRPVAAALTHLHELGVDLGRERGMGLELRPNGRQVQRGHVRNEDNGVRVAHAYARDLPILAVHLSGVSA